MIALFLVITLCLFCDMLSLLRNKEKRHKMPDGFEILFLLLSTSYKVNYSIYSKDLRFLH